VGRDSIVCGFPRSGNLYLHSVLQNSFPQINFYEKVGSIISLNLQNSIVPIRNPYYSVPSWSVFNNEPNLESIACWNLRFLQKVLDNMENLIIVDFNELIIDYTKVVKKVSEKFKEKSVNPNVNSFKINNNFESYIHYDSPTMTSCFNIYNKIINTL
jgi:hypothetical protein